MAGGLEIDDGGPAVLTYIANGEANRTVTVAVPAPYPGAYSTGTWEIFGPDHHPAGLALAPGGAASPQTFTPKVAGSYIVVFTGVLDPPPAAPADPTEQLTALYEVPSAYGAPIPSPRESTESGSTEGWARKIESKLHAVSQQMGGRVLVRVKNTDPATIAKGEHILITGLERVSAAVEAGDLPNEHVTEVVWSGVPALATNIQVVSRVVAYALDTVAQNETGTFVLGGLVPADTSLLVVGDIAYLTDAGTLGFSPGTFTRRLGHVRTVDTNTMATPGGFVAYDGMAPILSTDIVDALNGAALPGSGNVFATMADVGGGPGGGAYDWADGAPALNAGDWTLTSLDNAGAVAGTPPTLTPILSGAALRFDPGAVEIHAKLAYRATAAGDFIVAFRWSPLYNDAAVYPALGITWRALAFAMGNQILSGVGKAALYGGGLYRDGGTGFTDHRQGAFYTADAYTWGGPTFWGTWTQGRWTAFDVFVQRSGTDMRVYVGTPGGFPMLCHIEAGVPVLAGYCGLWMNVSNPGVRMALLAYRADLTAVPGYEP